MKSRIINLTPALLASISMASGTPAAADADSPNGLIEVSGSGSASSAPEIAHLSVRVTSRCNETSSGAKDANAILANKIIAVLESQTASADEVPGLDPLVATSGPNVRQTEYTGYGDDAKVLCEQKWRASEWISAVVTTLDELPAIQDALLRAVDVGSATAGLPQTWAEVDAPRYDLKPATSERLREEAQRAAWRDALGKVAVFKEACELRGLRLIRASEPHFDVTPVYKAAMAEPDRTTPMRPGSLNVSAQWNFVWGYDPVPGVECASETAPTLGLD